MRNRATDAVVERVDALLEGFAAAEPAVKAQAEELVRALTDVYGEALARVVEIARKGGIFDRFAQDKLIASLLAVHNLLPQTQLVQIVGQVPGLPPSEGRSETCPTCELCNALAGDNHGHVIDIEKRAILCACRPCYLLFTNHAAANGRYRSVPDRRVHVSDLLLDDALWDQFDIPVGIAFFFVNSSVGRAVALYPSPAGATESALPIPPWQELVRANPLLESLEPDTEALLVSRLRGRSDAFIVPIDACYELVGRMRRSWSGFSGGEQAWAEIDGFFDETRRRAAA